MKNSIRWPQSCGHMATIEEAIDQTVEIILQLEEIENKKPSKKRR